jgi:hypothetical protein
MTAAIYAQADMFEEKREVAIAIEAAVPLVPALALLKHRFARAAPDLPRSQISPFALKPMKSLRQKPRQSERNSDECRKS